MARQDSPNGSSAPASKITARKVECCSACSAMKCTAQFNGNALHVVDSTATFVITYLLVSETNQVIINSKGQQGRADILSCTITSPNTGHHLILEGHLTPRG